MHFIHMVATPLYMTNLVAIRVTVQITRNPFVIYVRSKRTLCMSKNLFVSEVNLHPCQ